MTLHKSLKYFYDKRRYDRDQFRGVTLKDGRGMDYTPYCPYSSNYLAEIIVRLLPN